MRQSQTSGETATAALPGQARGPQAVAQAFCALARAARLELRLFAPQLQPAVFGTAEAAGALAGFLTQHPRNRLRVLVEDAAQVRRDNDRLIELGRRLPDQLELRAVAEPDRGARDLYLVADRSALLHQEDVARDEAVVAESRLEAARLMERFNGAWERAEPLALRTLGL